MPHKCTRCENIFKDGAVTILNGCPNCGWNKFLYVRDESEPEIEKMSEHDEQHPAKKFVKEIDEFLSDQNIEVKKITKQDQEPESDRIESVRILGPGSYELNLDALLERKEIILAIKEDGSYIVHLPSVFNARRKKK